LENGSARYGIDRKDVPDILRRAADYLEKEQYPFIHPSDKEPEPKLKKQCYNNLLKVYSGKAKFPDYPKSKKLTKSLEKLFRKYKIKIEYYKT